MLTVNAGRQAARKVLGMQVRGLASQPSLDVEFPGMPELTPASNKSKPETKVTTLPNGLRVASEENYGQVTALGMFVDAGSRYETDANNGISHLMEHMAFKSTENRSHLRLVRDIEDIGGQMAAASAREFMIFQGECLREYVEKAVDILADTIVRPKLAPWDIDEQRKVIGYDLENMEANAQSVLTELLHGAAYGEQSPLGRSLWCPARNLNKLGEDELRAYLQSHFTAPRMVLSAAGVEHDRLVDLASKYFEDLPTQPANGVAPVTETAKYIGGERRMTADSPLTHVTLVFDAGGWKSDDLVDVCTLHMLLGGGGSFSAGGPGKGMYSRLYTNVLIKHQWVDSATAFNCMYNDGGLLGIYGTCAPQDAGRLVDVMAGELLDAASKAPSAEETQRAKNQLKSSVLMKLESRQVLFEDIGRQILTYGKHESAAELCARIDAVTPESLQKAAQKCLKSAATIASFGDVSAVPSYDAVANKFK